MPANTTLNIPVKSRHLAIIVKDYDGTIVTKCDIIVM